MKRYFGCLAFILFIVTIISSQAQDNSVAIGSNTVKSNAVLWLNGNGSQGLLLPAVGNTSNVSGPDAGMVVYQTSDNRVYFFDGDTWVGVGGGTGGGVTYSLRLTGTTIEFLAEGSVQDQIPLTSLVLGGDVTGTIQNTSVVALNGIALPNGTPSVDQVLRYNGTAWTYQDIPTGTFTGVVTDATLTGDGTAGAPLSVANVDDADADPSNENQDLSLTGTTLNISNGTGVDLAPIIPPGGTDDQNLVLTGDVLSIEGGTGSVDLSTYQDDADADPTNENQDLSLTGTTLNISNGTGVDLAPIIPPGGTDDQNLVLTGDVLSIEGGTGSVDLSTYVADADADPLNEIQTLGLTGNVIDISGGNSIDLTPILSGGSGDITDVIAGTGLSGGGATGSVTLNLSDVGTPGTYTKVTTDAQGRVTTGASLVAADIPNLTLAKITDAGSLAGLNAVDGATITDLAITDADLSNTAGINIQKLDFSGTSDGDILQIVGGVPTWSPAGGSNDAQSLQGTPIDAGLAPTSGQVLKWDGAQWVAGLDDTGAGGAPTLNPGEIIVGDGANNAAAGVTGDLTMTNGDFQIAADVVTTTEIGSAGITDANKVLTTDASGNPQWELKTAVTSLPQDLDFTGNVITLSGDPTPTSIDLSAYDADASDDVLLTTPATNNISGSFAGGFTINNDVINSGNIVDGGIISDDIQDGTISTLDIASGGNDQVLTTDAGGTVTWVPKGSLGGSQNLQQVLTQGNDAGALAITNLADPTGAQDAATRNYVDTQIGGVSALPPLTDLQIIQSSGVDNPVGVTVGGALSVGAGGIFSINNDVVNGANIVDQTITNGDISLTADIDVTKLASPGGTDKGILTTTGTANGWLTTANANRVFGTDLSNTLVGRPVVLSTTGPVDNTGIRPAGTATDAALVSEAAVREALDGISGFNTLNEVPRGDGTGLVSSNIRSDGTNIGIGVAPPPSSRLAVQATDLETTIRVGNNFAGAGTNTGVRADVNGSSNQNVGVYGNAFSGDTAIGLYGTSGSSTNSYGVFGTVSGASVSTAYGLFGNANSAGINYGVFGSASGGTDNYAGFFSGDVVVTQAIGFGGTPDFGTAGQVLTSQGPGTTPIWQSAGGGSVWALAGNTGTTPGIGNDFIGTTDAQDLVFATNNVERMRIANDAPLNTDNLITITELPGVEIKFVDTGNNADIVSDGQLNISANYLQLGGVQTDIAGDLSVQGGGILNLRGDGAGSTTPILLWDGNDTNYVGFSAPTVLTNTYILRMPTDLPATDGQVLTSDIAGNLSWSTSGITTLQSAYDAPLGSEIILDGANDFEVKLNDASDFFTLDQTNVQVNVTGGITALSNGTTIAASTSSNLAGEFAISGINTGTGDVAGFFWASNPAGGTDSHGIYGQADGQGAGVFGLTNGTAGQAARFVTLNAGNANPTVEITNQGTGINLFSDGPIQIQDGSEVAGYVLTSDANGLASWQPGGANSLQTAYDGGNQIQLDGSNEFNLITSGGTPIITTNDANAFLGVGAPVPVSKLQVGLGNIQIDREQSLLAIDPTDVFPFQAKSVPQYSIGWYDDTDTPGLAQGWFSAFPGFKFFTNGVNSFTISQFGNVGIGTVGVPTEKLDVAGSINVSVGSGLAIGNVQFVRGSTTADNVFIGGRAGNSLVTGSANVMVGTNAGANSDNVIGNTFVGNNAALFNTTGASNAFFGGSAGDMNETGSNNTFIGVESGIDNVAGNFNTFLGFRAKPSVDGLSNANAIGANAVVSSDNTVRLGVDGTALEFNGELRPGGPGTAGTVGHVLTSQGAGVAPQWQANPTSPWVLNAPDISFSGGNAGIGTTTPTEALDVVGNINIPFTNAYYIGGFQAFAIDFSEANTYLGYNAGAANTGVRNTFLGQAAGLANTSGEDNTYVGRNAGREGTTAGFNTIVGKDAGINNNGVGNTFLGSASAATATTTARSVLIGRFADVGSGGLDNAIAIGFQATVNQSNTMILGNTSLTRVAPGGDNVASLGGPSNRWTDIYATGAILTSDRREKENIEGLQYGLSDILKLVPVQYNWINKNINDGVHLGLIAQEVQEIIPEVVNVADNEERSLGLAYTELIPVTIKAIQEQQEIIEAQKVEIEALKATIAKLMANETNTQVQIDELKAQMTKLTSLLTAEAKNTNE